LKFYWASFDDFFIYIIINRSLSTAAWASLLLALRPLTDIQWRRRSNSSNSSPAMNPAAGHAHAEAEPSSSARPKARTRSDAGQEYAVYHIIHA